MTPGLHALLSRVLLCCLMLAQASRLAVDNRIMPSAPPDFQESGSPAFTIYGPEAIGMGSTPTSLFMMPDGRIMVVSQREIAFTDGSRWEVIRQAPGDIQYAPEEVMVEDNGKIYASVHNGLAELVLDHDGMWRFKVLKIDGFNDGRVLRFVSRLANSALWHSGSGKLFSWRPGSPLRVLGTADNIDHLFELKGVYYVSNHNVPEILKVGANGIVGTGLATSTDRSGWITASTKLSDNTMLLGTSRHGFFRFDGNHLSVFPGDGPLSGGNQINALCRVGRKFAASIENVGIVFFDELGHVEQVLDGRLDHRLAKAKRMVYTPQGVLWCLLSEGIACIQFPSRLSRLDSMLNVSINYVAPVRNQSRLWMLADGVALEGTYDASKRLTGFAVNSPPDVEIWQLVSVDNRLLATAGDGIYEHSKGRWQMLIPGLHNARLSPVPGVSGLIRFLAEGEAGTIDLRWESISVSRTSLPELSKSYGIVDSNDQKLWSEQGTANMAVIDFSGDRPKARIYSEKDGLPQGWVALFFLDGKVLMNVGNKIMTLDPDLDRIVEATAWLQRWPLLAVASGRAMRDKQQRLWIPGPDSIQLFEDDRDGKARLVAEKMPPELHPFEFTMEDNGVVWMFDQRRLMRYDPRIAAQSLPKPTARITRVELPGGTYTMYSPDATPFKLPMGENSLVVFFAAIANPFTQRTTFEFKLDGDWTSTGTMNTTTLGRLPPGDYVFRLRAVCDGVPGEEATLHFVVQRPWFMTTWFYTLCGLLGLGAIALLILTPIRIERRQKARLASQVAERTHELSLSEERFRRLNMELEQRVDERTSELQHRIAEVEHLNHMLDKSKDKLYAANQELESFTYSASHDLRAPLRNITGFMELLQRKIQSGAISECSRHIDIVIKESRRMATLIEDLLSFSRVGRVEMRMEPVSLSSLVHAYIEESGRELAGRKVQWVIAETPIIQGDKILLRQVVANLIGNAIKFTKKRPDARIEFACLGRDADGESNVFYIRDNGAGFNPQYGSRLFGVFQRLHSAQDFEGTGIGLANVKSIITRHGGRVWAEGQVDIGATFYFTIPTNPKAT